MSIIHVHFITVLAVCRYTDSQIDMAMDAGNLSSSSISGNDLPMLTHPPSATKQPLRHYNSTPDVHSSGAKAPWSQIQSRYTPFHFGQQVCVSAVYGGQRLCCWEPTCSDHADLSVLKGEGLILVRSSRFLFEICTTGFRAVWQCQSFSPVVFSSLSGLSEDLALVKFMYFAFTCLPCWNHHRQFKSLVLCSCDVFQAVMNSLCLLFLELFGFASPSLG